jgi:hypothetical protein
MVVSGQCHAPAALYPREMTPPPVPIGQEAEWASELVRTQRLEEKSFASAGDRIPEVQFLVRQCTVLATLPPFSDHVSHRISTNMKDI